MVNGAGWESSVWGVGSDNPTYPNALTPGQERKAISFMFKGKSHFTATLAVMALVLLLAE